VESLVRHPGSPTFMRYPYGTYEPEIVALMGAAFDAARQQAQAANLNVSAAGREAMGSKILAAVESGERELDKLTQVALSALDPQKFPVRAHSVPPDMCKREGPRTER
jgi:hypothetical protein